MGGYRCRTRMIRMKTLKVSFNLLRAGAKLGSKACLTRLKGTYENGYYGQNENESHAACYARLRDSIDDFDRSKPIPNFDKLCPLQPYQP